MNGLGQAGTQIPEANYQSQASEPAMMGEGKPASPEEQAVYNKFVAHCILAIFDDKFMPKAIEMLKGATTPVEGVARVASSVALRVFEIAKSQKQEIPGPVVLHGGKEVIEAVKELAEASGLPALDEEQTEAAYYHAADLFRNAMEKQGLVNDDARKQDLQAFQEMEKNGQLDAVLQHIQQSQGGQ
jgi:hypothetical protein